MAGDRVAGEVAYRHGDTVALDVLSRNESEALRITMEHLQLLRTMVAKGRR